MLEEKLKMMIVEDDPSIYGVYDALFSHDYSIIGIHETAEDAIAHLKREKPDVIITDYRLKGELRGDAVAEFAYEKYGMQSIFASTIPKDLEEEIRSKPYCHAFCPKEPSSKLLEKTVREYLNLQTFTDRNSALQYAQLF